MKCCMLETQNNVLSTHNLEIFYNRQKKFQFMSFTDIDNSDYERRSNESARHFLYLQHLKDHKLDTIPEKFEFLITVNSLFESKIKFKIQHEINNPLIDYRMELPTLIIRSNGSFTKGITDRLPEDLGLFVANCFSYNSLKPILLLLSDFALVNDYVTLTTNRREYDLQNDIISEFYNARNEAVHALSNVEKISDINYIIIKKNIEQICEDVTSMITSALFYRRCTIDNFPHPIKDDIINEQLEWLEESIEDIIKDRKRKYNSKNQGLAESHYAKFWFEEFESRGERYWKYSLLRKKLKENRELKNKIGAINNA